MFNIMLDEKPQDWNGFPVDMSFRTGVQISLLITDGELSDMEKYEQICELMFPGIMPSAEDIPDVIDWYMNGWYTDKPSKRKNTVKDMDFDIDQWRIYSAFRKQYGIDLNTEDMHYWAFMGLLTTLDECAFTRVIDIRNKKITKHMTAEEKNAIKEARAIYCLDRYRPEPETLADKMQEKEVIDRFMQFAKLKGKEG